MAAFLSLALPVKMPQSWVDGFVRGLLTLAKEHGVTLAGGDTAQSPGRPSEARILADIVVVGSVPLGQAVRRSGAKPGDAIYVTGELGGSAVALDRMYAQPKRKLSAIKFPRHFYPEPRLRVGRLLRERGLITAMIDLSDGLSTDLDHLCRESRVSAQVSPEMIPRSKGATLMQVLHGGEDYELLFTVPAGHRVPRTVTGIALTRIGEIRPRQQGPLLVELLGATGKMRGLRPQGWEHLSG